MDFTFDPDEITVPQVALYLTISFLIVTVIGIFLYITCSKKYKLNWFEKNLLETACESQEFGARFVHTIIYMREKINLKIEIYGNGRIAFIIYFSK